MVGIIVGLLMYFLCDALQRWIDDKCGCGDDYSKPRYRMKEVGEEEVIFFTDTVDNDEAFKL